MTESSQGEIHEDEDLVRKKRLRSAIDDATELASRFRYADAIVALDNAIGSSAPRDTPERLTLFAADLRAKIVKRRQDFLARAYLGVIGVLSIAIIGWLYFTEVGSVEIVAEIQTRGFFAKIDEDAHVAVDELTGLMLNNADRLSGFVDSVEIFARASTPNLQQQNEPEVIRLNPNINTEFKFQGGAGGIRIESKSLSVNQLKLNAGHTIEISMGAGTSSSSITLQHEALEGGATVRTDGVFLIHCGGCSLEQGEQVIATDIGMARTRPRPRKLIIASGILPLFYTFQTDSGASADRAMSAIKGLIGISEIDFTSSPSASPVSLFSGDSGQPVSLVKGGRVEIVEIEGLAVDISESEFVDFGEKVDLYISEIGIGESLNLELRGQVSSLKTGFGRHYLHSKMPSRLEWFLNNELVTVFFSSVSVLFGFLIAVIVKLRLIEKI